VSFSEPLPALLFIGQFSRLSGLSCRMLRFYEEQHLLVPACRNPDTGYRRYLSSQLEEARFLLRLRRADFSVEDIRSILQGWEKRKELLQRLGEEQRKSLEEKIRALEGSLRELELLEREWELPRYGFTHVKPLPGYSASFQGEREHLRELARRTAKALVEISPGVLPGVPYLCTYSLEKGPGEATLHIPGEGVCPHTLPGGVMATVLHRGEYAKLPETLKGLLRWVESQGHAPRGTVREWYFPGDEKETSSGEVELSLPLDLDMASRHTMFDA